MLAVERRRLLLEHLHAHGSASLADLVSSVGGSEVTIRRDLRSMEEAGLLRRHRGGASVELGEPERRRTPSSTTTELEPSPATLAMAALAASLVQDGDAVMLGAGRITPQLAAYLADRRDLTVVTNSLQVGEALARSRNVNVVLTGGSLRASGHALVGSAAEASLAGMRVQRAFLSGDGLTTSWGLSTANMSAAGVDRAIAAAAAQVLVLVDHSRLGTDSLFQTVSPERLTDVITDEGADPAMIAELEQAGVRVLLARPPLT